MTRGRADANPKKRLVSWIVILAIICGCFYAYTRSQGSSALEYGSKSLRKFGSSYWRGDEDTSDSSAKLDEDGDGGIILKSFPVSEIFMSQLLYHFAPIFVCWLPDIRFFFSCCLLVCQRFVMIDILS